VLVKAVREAGGVTVTILNGDCREMLKTLPSESVQMCVTSPPYFNLRDYQTGTWSGGDAACDHTMRRSVGASTLMNDGRERIGLLPDHKYTAVGNPFRALCGKCGATRTDSQIGLEQTPELYVAELVAVFREVRRVLRDDGVLFLNLGDSYGGTAGNTRGDGAGGGKERGDMLFSTTSGINKGGKPKDLLMIPARVALALQADGWWLRSDIIWAKPNPMPESVTDRPTSAHEHVFLLAKSSRYFWDSDAVREEGTIAAGTLGAKGSEGRFNTPGVNSRPPEYKVYSGTRNIRNVWTIATHSFPDAHFATFPPELAERCIRAGSSGRGCCAKCGAPWIRQTEKSVQFTSGSGKSGNVPNGKHAGAEQSLSGEYDIRMGPVVTNITAGWAASCACDAAVVPCTILDPFCGAGTSLMVADRLRRHAIGIELNADYAAMIRARLVKDAGLFMEIMDTPRAAPPCDPDLARRVDLWREPESGK
jgi:DNA modification methylase